ncbi:hypothetical protein MRB53_007905 [Persea americana]|uniref:Uncharacterized protein n=1 Tax=Persea americana TaxID=3435 RepID=A0ACC2MLW8_PERAE|nr:hypothetical protein MRB53_007905 [Persea americana]
MSSESANLEERLKSLIAQLKTESGILDRIVYKGKNQHRHCLYFQCLLKVRRDVRLLISAGLEEILSYHFQIINGDKPKQKVYLLERLKVKKHHNGKHNFQERLLGVARLLSQMVEPILKAAIQISTLLARSFFMGFSLTSLAMLARFRVLVQQMLLDIVQVFNMVSSISQKEQSVKLKQEEIEVFQEYYPLSGEVLTLQCLWEGDKFVLLENTNETELKNTAGDLKDGRDISFGTPSIQYQRIEVPSEDPCLNDEFRCETAPANHTNEEFMSSIDENKGYTINLSSHQSLKISTDIEVKDCADENGINDERSPKGRSPAEGSKVENSSSSMSPTQSTADNSKVACRSPFQSTKTKSQLTVKKVAFVSVRKSAPSEASDGSPLKKLKTTWSSSSDNDSGDPFFSLLAAGAIKDSLF